VVCSPIWAREFHPREIKMMSRGFVNA
jgi:hypothetical protein